MFQQEHQLRKVMRLAYFVSLAKSSNSEMVEYKEMIKNYEDKPEAENSNDDEK